MANPVKLAPAPSPHANEDPDLRPVDGKAADEVERQAFWAAETLLRRRIELFLSLPLGRIDTLSLKANLEEIGTT